MIRKLMFFASFALFVVMLHAHGPDCKHDHRPHDSQSQAHHDDCDESMQGHEHDCSEHHHFERTKHSNGHHNCSEHVDVIILSDEQIIRSGIKTSVAQSGLIRTDAGFSGEIVVNRDLQIHHVPKTAGVVEKIFVDIGDEVQEGDTIAIIDSAELAVAKSLFYQAFNFLGTALGDLQRAHTVANNTLDLIEKLKESPDLDFLRNKEYGDMGKYRALLLSSYSEYLIAKNDLKRQAELRDQRIVSEAKFLQVESNYEKTKSSYLTIKDDSRYKVQQNLIEAEREQRVMEFKMRSAQQRLKILGLDVQEIEAIKKHGAYIKQLCTDASCSESVYHSQHYHPAAEKDFSLIEIKAAMSGTVTMRSLELGEEVESDRIIFTIADLNSLWVILNAPPRDLTK